MANDLPSRALAPLAPGPMLRIGQGRLFIDIAPSAGGRIAQIRFDDVPWLMGHGDESEAMIAWGCYPMLPWAGRIRHGRFRFDERDYQLPINLDTHAIHGFAFGLPWRIDAHSDTHIELSLALPMNAQWPFGGIAGQRIEVIGTQLRMHLTLTAGEHAMPATIGWHPWFRKPDRLEFEPSRIYPRDAEGIATLPLAEPPPGPWDDCFLNDKSVRLWRHGQCLQLSSDCTHWVVFDETAYATCVEPQSGPPDAFNLAPASRIAAGSSISRWFLLDWCEARP
jgi:aldose 1-epimerase